MAEKISKTARASMKGKVERTEKMCPECGNYMTATKLVKRYGYHGGMWWLCDCGHRERICS